MKIPYIARMEIAMATRVEERSKITAKGQTTVPIAVRRALGVDIGGEIAFVVGDDGVQVRRVETEEADPVIDNFLHFLATDMTRNPQNVQAFPSGLAKRMATLTADMPVDLDDDIDGPVAL